MSEFRMQVSNAGSQITELQSCGQDILSIAGSVREICRNLSIEGSAKQTLQFKLNKIADNISLEGVHATQMSSVLAQALDLYRKADREGREVGDGAEESPQNGTGEAPISVDTGITGGTGTEKGESTSWLAKLIDDMYDDLAPIMDLLKEILDTDEGSFGKSLLDWIKSFKDFIDNKAEGIMGGSALCKLTEASFSGWKAVYDWFYDKYKNGGGIFTEGWNKGVHVGGVIAAFISFGGDFLEAISKGEGKGLLDKIANYIDCGGSIFDIGSSVYELKHIGEKTNLITYLWGSFVDGVTATGSQLLRSISKYSLDGHWSVEDTASTGIDIGVAGLYGILHHLSLGGDLWLLNRINEASGREHVTEEEYIQGVQDGLRQMARNFGETPLGRAYVDAVDSVIDTISSGRDFIENLGRGFVRAWSPGFW